MDDHLGLIGIDRAWLLTLLSSLMCIIGASTIYLDVLVRFVNPRSQFSIRSNDKFLISGFSLSCGSLLLTSLYRLLPKAHQFFKRSINNESLPWWLNANSATMICFMSGIIVCYGLNEVIHYATSESIVHCAHGSEDSDSSHGSHTHSDQHHNHSHSNSSTSFQEDNDDDLKYKNVHSHSHHGHMESHDEESMIANETPHQTVQPTESTPLIHDIDDSSLPKRKKSIMAMIDNFAHPQSQQVCQGINDTDCAGFPCINEELTDRVSNDVQHLDFYRDISLRRTKSSLVAYITDTNSDQHHQHHPGSPTPVTSDLPVQQYLESSVISPLNIRLATEPNLDRHQAHTDDHHHQVTTPISRLLSIGLQTCLALALHKFPEGFITYATTKADPELGLSIFLSLAIHNIVEGFSMVLPLYLALNSRTKAFGITFLLGGLSQPIGAIAALFLLNGRKLDKHESSNIFGILISITAGFLTIVSLQLFASAISFGGTTTTVIRWSVIGMFIIMLSSILTV